MEKRPYTTKQREIILAFFEKNSSSSFSAKEIIENDSVSVGAATVYRCLSLLSSEGRLRCFTDGGVAKYQYATECCKEHFHLKCISCGETVHMDCDFMNDIEKHIEKEHDFYVDNNKTVIYGLCGRCSKKKKVNESDNSTSENTTGHLK